MKKRLVSLVLAVALLFSAAPAALAAPQTIEPWVIDWLGATIMTDIKTPHDYLGDVTIDGLYYWNGDACTWTFDVYVVDNSVTNFTMESYTIERTTDFVTFAYDIGMSYVYYDPDVDGVVTNPAFTADLNFRHATEQEPLVSSFYKYEGMWFPQRHVFELFDASISYDMDEEELYDNMIGWIGYGVIIFTKSEIEQYNATGKLPKMASFPVDEDLSDMVDLTELYALLDANKSAASTTPSVQSFKPTPSTVYFDGKAVSFEAYNIGGNNFFKLRDLAYVLSGTEKQFEVGFDDATRVATITTGQPYTPIGGELAPGDGSEKAAPPSKMKILLDGQPLDLTVYLINGNNFFKLRDLMQVIDVFVEYDEVTRNVIVDSTKGYVEN